MTRLIAIISSSAAISPIGGGGGHSDRSLVIDGNLLASWLSSVNLARRTLFDGIQSQVEATFGLLVTELSVVSLSSP